MTDQHQNAPVNPGADVITPASPRSPRLDDSTNEKHFSMAPTLTSKDVDAQSKKSDDANPQLSPRSANVQFEQQPEIHAMPKSPLSAPNDFRNTGTWTDAAYPKKPDYDVEEHEVDPADGIDWEPGFANQFPWIGFAGFITMVFATAMAVAILCNSNKKRVLDWPFTKYTVQPNVVLNIANQVQNLGLITMIMQGLAIAWWRKALKGSSLKTLHRNHAYSISFYAIMTSGKHFNTIALAALMTKFAVIDSTLFQKATKTAIVQQKAYANRTVTAWMETQWPANKGGIPGDAGSIKTIDVDWAAVVNAYTGKIANGKVHDNLEGKASFFGCPERQECTGVMKGIGFAYTCDTQKEDVDYGLQRQSQRGANTSTTYPLWFLDFHQFYANDTTNYASIRMDMQYVDSSPGNIDGSCPGSRTSRTCWIRPAIVQYPVIVMTPSKEELAGKNIVVHIKFFNQPANASALGSPLGGEQIDGLKVLEYADLNEKEGDVSTIGALALIFNNLYGSSANLTFGDEWNIQSRGSQAQTYYYADNDQDDHTRCDYDIKKQNRDDPAFEILRKLNTFSFVTGLYLNNAPLVDGDVARNKLGLPHQEFRASITGIVEQYVTSFGYMAGALVATLITFVLVLPVYWGFWELGRKVTLGPLEISHAFNAPIIAPDKTKNHHGDFDEVLEDVGKRRVQYGQLVGAPPGQMGLAEPHKVATPDARTGGHIMDGRNRRIAMGAAVGGVIAATVGANTH